MSSLGWIDFSSEHRDKVRTVIDLLSAPGVIDELGIGVIRDSFADRMFPGISTIQTRPKYFTVTALLLKDYVEKQKGSPQPLERFLEDAEKRCRIKLIERHGTAEPGIIGSTFGLRPDRDVVRKPSSVYWNGLRQFGFVSPRHLSLPEFGRRLADDRAQLRALLDETRDEGGDNDAVNPSQRIRVMAPEVPSHYWETLSIHLLPEEAEFLRNQITACQPDSLIGQILMDDASVKEMLKLGDEAGFEEFSDLPFISSLKSKELRRTVRHARDFWRLMEGAHIRYNCLLQGDTELGEQFEERWKNWRSHLSEYLAEWDTDFMWLTVSNHGSKVTESTRYFIKEWLAECRFGASNLKRCNDLVRRQELHNKGNRARLRDTNQEGINKWIGIDGLDYRFPQVRQLIRDIREAEQGGSDA